MTRPSFHGEAAPSVALIFGHCHKRYQSVPKKANAVARVEGGAGTGLTLTVR
jgi:hypothetical protein